MTQSKDKESVITIKKYANRRLYNTDASSYVTLEDLAEMVKDGTDFVVKDAKSGEDITRSVLTQIIFEEESKGQNLLPINFLRQLIRFYGDSMQALVPSYLEFSMDSLTREQEKFQKQMSDTFGATPFNGLEEQARQNMAVFQKSMQMFNPFASAAQGAAEKPESASQEDPSAEKSDDLDSLREQLIAMQAQINKLANGDK
ncbi:MAG: polyhydroxyalkanoate synthesis repressor PhaR [Hyphomicrobiales bacterium]